MIFFLNQQFIIWSVQADRGSYFRNYVHEKRANMTGKEEKERKEKEREEKEQTNCQVGKREKNYLNRS